VLVPNGKEGALTLASHQVRSILWSGLVPKIERIFGISSRSALALLQPNTSTMRIEWLHPPPLSNQIDPKCDNGVSTLPIQQLVEA
jgi:hypothetical protein